MIWFCKTSQASNASTSVRTWRGACQWPLRCRASGQEERTAFFGLLSSLLPAFRSGNFRTGSGWPGKRLRNPRRRVGSTCSPRWVKACLGLSSPSRPWPCRSPAPGSRNTSGDLGCGHICRAVRRVLHCDHDLRILILRMLEGPAPRNAQSPSNFFRSASWPLLVMKKWPRALAAFAIQPWLAAV
jgi:hypothetical protein